MILSASTHGSGERAGRVLRSCLAIRCLPASFPAPACLGTCSLPRVPSWWHHAPCLVPAFLCPTCSSPALSHSHRRSRGTGELLHQAQRRGRDEAFASPRMCPPASRPSEGAARHPLPSSFPVTDEVGLPGAPHIPGASGWGGRERGEEGGKSSFGHGGIKGRSRSVCAPLTPRWVLLLPECSQRSPWEL